MTPETKSREDVLNEVRQTLAKANADQLVKLLRDIRATPRTNKDRMETLH